MGSRAFSQLSSSLIVWSLASAFALGEVQDLSATKIINNYRKANPGAFAATRSNQNPGLSDKIDSILLKARARRLNPRPPLPSVALVESDSSVRFNAQSEMQIYVFLEPFTHENVQELVSSGLRLDRAVERMSVAQGWLAPDKLESIAAKPFVRKIKRPNYATTRCLGNFCSEGDAILKADKIRELGVTGKGIRVGVISNGVDSRAEAIASGDLPPSVVVNPSISGNGEEGTAMLEIIHDLAPDAQLFFSGPGTSAEMVDSINWFIGQGADVIVDDLGFYSSPFFEDDEISNAADDAVVVHQRIYASSAGNDCGSHYQGDFIDADGIGPSTFHDFDGGTGVKDYLFIFSPPGGSVTVILQWNDPFGASSNDYDLHVLDLSSGQPAISSTEVQDGNDDPFEVVFGVNPSTTAFAVGGIAIENRNGAASPRTLELFVLDGVLDDPNANCEDAIFGHPAESHVLSCASINATDATTGTIAAYSSFGPSTISFPSRTIRQTPTIAAIDGVAVTGAGGFPSPFFGTSASSPHVAAVCALLLEASNKAASPQMIRQAISQGIIDRGLPGFDSVFGFGQLDALAAMNSLCTLFPKPEAPAQVTATRGTFQDHVVVSWAPVQGIDKYQIWRAAENNPAAAKLLAESTTLTYVDRIDLKPGTDYFYWIISVKRCSSSDFGASDRGIIGGSGGGAAVLAPACGIGLCGTGTAAATPLLLFGGWWMARRRRMSRRSLFQ